MGGHDLEQVLYICWTGILINRRPVWLFPTVLTEGLGRGMDIDNGQGVCWLVDRVDNFKKGVN